MEHLVVLAHNSIQIPKTVGRPQFNPDPEDCGLVTGPYLLMKLQGRGVLLLGFLERVMLDDK
jgi:hypothetical protein